MACKHMLFMATFDVSRKRWYKSLKNSYLQQTTIAR